MRGFIAFIRKQGVVGLAVGFILGGALSMLVKALVDDLVSPVVGLGLNKANGLAEASTTIAGATIKYGDFLSNLINFLVVALVVYFGVKGFGIDKWDEKDEDKK